MSLQQLIGAVMLCASACLPHAIAQGDNTLLSDEIQALLVAPHTSVDQNLERLDVNADGRVDVGDILLLRNPTADAELTGKRWLFTLSFPAQAALALPLSFALGIDLSETGGVAADVVGFDPTKGIVQQVDLTGSASDTPNFGYPVGYMIPPGTAFSRTDDDTSTTLTAVMQMNAEQNPLRRDLTLTWEITIDRQKLALDDSPAASALWSVEGAEGVKAFSALGSAEVFYGGELD